jgi:hypothetical protein
MLYEVAIITKPSPKQLEEGEQEKLILPPCAVIASDDKSAAVVAVMENKDKIPNGDMKNLEVLVRSFI